METRQKHPGGRPKGSPNIATRELKEAARAFSEDALRTIAEIMREGENHAVRLAAAKEMLDRGFGKSTQMVATDEDSGGFNVSVIEYRIVETDN